MNLTKREWLVFLGIVVLFLAIRLPAIYTPYHQDEYKWPLYAEGVVYKPGSVPHPPLTEFIYRVIGGKIGLDNFRFIPLTFGFLNLFLLFYLVRKVVNTKTAFWAIFLFSFSFYSVLSNLMVDVDGSVMPFFFLIMNIGYFRLRENLFQIKKFDFRNLFSILLLIFGAIGGFLIKVIFVLPIFALFVDFLIEKEVFSDRKKVVKYLIFTILGALLLISVLLLVRYVFPFFSLSKAFKYWEHFAVFYGRGWTQTFIQFVKSLMYISPLLLLPMVFVNKEVWNKWRPMFLFLILGSLFYLFVFDFSLGALDRYFQFTIIPLVVISSFIFTKVFGSSDKIKKKDFLVMFFFCFLLVFIQFLNHFVPPLYPKTEWLAKIMHLKWNFLFPFMGGSGPIPFYVSFLFVALVWLLSMAFIFSGLFDKQKTKRVLFTVLILGLLYNAIFAEEYLFGKINGSSKNLVKEAVHYIAKNNDIKKVVVYNDNGGWDIRKTGKYARRMYATPQFEEEYKRYFKDFYGHILFLEIPTLDQESFYVKYMNSCDVLYQKKDKYIKLKVFYCHNVKKQF